MVHFNKKSIVNKIINCYFLKKLKSIFRKIMAIKNKELLLQAIDVYYFYPKKQRLLLKALIQISVGTEASIDNKTMLKMLGIKSISTLNVYINNLLTDKAIIKNYPTKRVNVKKFIINQEKMDNIIEFYFLQENITLIKK
jgi:hypothetical protein